MKTYPIDAIRNVALLGTAERARVRLAESMLYASGGDQPDGPRGRWEFRERLRSG